MIALFVDLNQARKRTTLTAETGRSEENPVVNTAMPVSALLGDSSTDKEMKDKIRKYIVENSDLRLQLQKLKQHYEEVRISFYISGNSY